MHNNLLKSFVMLGFFFLVGCANPAPAPPTSTAAPHEVQHTSLPLVEQWRRRTPDSNVLDHAPGVWVQDEKVLISFIDEPYEENNLQSWLVALSLSDGQVLWQQYLTNPGYGTFIDNSYLDAQNLYLIYSFELHAFDLQTGAHIWGAPLVPGGHTAFYFDRTINNPLTIHSSQNEIILIDPSTGAELTRQPLENFGASYHENIAFMLQENDLVALDTTTGQTLWSRRFKEILPWPTYLGNEILYQSDEVIYTLVRQNMYTGEIIWETEQEYVSNYVLTDAGIYMLRQDGVLALLDVETGGLIGKLAFGRPFDHMNTNRPSWIVWHEPYLITYLEDSQELIVFR